MPKLRSTSASPRKRHGRPADGPSFSYIQEIAYMRSVLARFDLQSAITSINIAIICNRSANLNTGAVGKPVRQLIDRMVDADYLIELEPQPHLYGQARRFQKGRISLEEFKTTFAQEIAEYERTRNQPRVCQYSV